MKFLQRCASFFVTNRQKKINGKNNISFYPFNRQFVKYFAKTNLQTLLDMNRPGCQSVSESQCHRVAVLQVARLIKTIAADRESL